LIEIIYELERREEKLEKRLERARARLKDRTMRMERAGSLAEVAAVIAGLFEAADETAAMYLAGVKAQEKDVREAEERAS
jgi:hypothetical protein